jgi:cytochrome P450
MGLVGLIIHTLLEQPRLCGLARETPALAPVIVSEILRLESNVQRSLRICRERRVVGGTTIEPGERVLLLIGAANRDPAAFPYPDDVALQKRPTPDVSFGAGSHFCLGASLARLEGRIALEHFLRLPAVEREAEERWYPGRSIRRLIELPVRVVEPASNGGV